MEVTNGSLFIRLFWLAWAFSLVGFNNGIVGPSLLDLASTVHVRLDKMNTIFVAQGIGFIVGTLISGMLVPWVNLYLYLGGSLTLGALVNIFIPKTNLLTWMTAMFFAQGFTKGMTDITILVICIQLYPVRNNWQLQFVTITGSLAAFIAPFIVEPFLSKESHTEYALSGDYEKYQQPLNCSATTAVNGSSSVCDGKTRIQYPFLIIAGVVSPSIVACLYFYWKDRLGKDPDDYQLMGDHVSPATRYSSWKQKWPVLVLLFVFHIPVFGILLAYSHLLTPFGLKSHLRLTKPEMAHMVSLLWGSHLVGRISNTFFSRFINLSALLGLNFAGLLASAGILVSRFQIYEVALWISTSGFGLFQSSFLPAVVSWAGDFITLDLLVLTSSIVASGLGEMVIPSIVGILFHQLGPGTLQYAVLAACVFETTIFFCLFLLRRRHQKQADE